jgi:hypothetical protein
VLPIWNIATGADVAIDDRTRLAVVPPLEVRGYEPPRRRTGHVRCRHEVPTNPDGESAARPRARRGGVDRCVRTSIDRDNRCSKQHDPYPPHALTIGHIARRVKMPVRRRTSGRGRFMAQASLRNTQQRRRGSTSSERFEESNYLHDRVCHGRCRDDEREKEDRPEPAPHSPDFVYVIHPSKTEARYESELAHLRRTVSSTRLAARNTALEQPSVRRGHCGILIWRDGRQRAG